MTAPVAQSVERLTPDLKVMSSSPMAGDVFLSAKLVRLSISRTVLIGINAGLSINRLSVRAPVE